MNMAGYIDILCNHNSPSQPHRGDQAGPAYIVKAPALHIPSAEEGLVYRLRWCKD